MRFLFLFGLAEIVAAGQLCMNCKNVVNPHECDQVTKCGDHEQCYMQQYLRHNTIWYDLGCQSNIVCQANANGPPVPIIGKRNVRGQDLDPETLTFDLDGEDDDGRITLCESCCNTDVCNNGGACGVADFNYYNGRLCFKCSQQLTPDSCDRVTLCYQDRYCYIHKTKPAVGFTYVWETGCAQTAQNCTPAYGTICSNCCSGNLCNKECTLQTYFLAVAAQPPKIISTVTRPRHYKYGDNVQLICTIESNPKQDALGWNMMTDPSQIPTNIQLSYGTNYVIVDINNFQSQNVAGYQCFVHNALGQDTRNVTLNAPH
ncbi:uncharacterized protein LOC134262453 [Saccostrea cucullata]|uniref:uncharacterized protein LOC134262453 n=1 Tax=Saccostrea cuccullata TaxID=36930 RepID=UPI002ED18D88